MNNGSDTMPPGWTRVALGEVVEVLDRLRVPVNSKERAGRQGPVPYYGATGQVGWIDKHIFDEELVLLGEDGAPFLDPAKPKAYLIRGKSWVNNHAHVLRGKGVLNSFLMHQLNALDYHGAVTGTTRLKLPQAPMKKLQVVVPPAEKQERIVAEIDKQFTRLDAGIETLKRLQAHLRRYRAAVLKAACEGRLLGTRWPRSGTETARRQDSTPKLPALPVGWKWACLPELGELNRGKSKHRPRDDPRLYGGKYPFIQTGDVKNSRGAITAYTQTYSEEGLAQSRLWPAGTLCITIAANIADTGILTFPACFPDSVVGFIADDARASVRYVEFFLRTAKDNLARYAPATAQKNINLETLRALTVPLPPREEQDGIVADVERRFSVVTEAEATVEAGHRRAARLRQAILRAAFEGRLITAEQPTDTFVA